MTINVRLFAMLRERAGWRVRSFEVATGSTVDEVWRAVAAAAPGLAGYASVVRFARNGRYAEANDVVANGDELAVIPPVAGGGAGYRRIELSEAPFSDGLLAELRRTVPTNAEGAVVIFVGQTRDTPGTPAPGEEAEAARHAGQTVTGLDYEAFDEMALGVLHDVADEIEARFGVSRVAIIHRTGHVGLGEASVVIAAAAAHRGAAFDACRYAIEELKARAPIWKREQFADGSVWIGAPARTAAAATEEGS